MLAQRPVLVGKSDNGRAKRVFHSGQYSVSRNAFAEARVVIDLDAVLLGQLLGRKGRSKVMPIRMLKGLDGLRAHFGRDFPV